MLRKIALRALDRIVDLVVAILVVLLAGTLALWDTYDIWRKNPKFPEEVYPDKHPKERKHVDP